VITFMQHEKRRFVEKLDYLTSVGWYRGGRSRQDLGLTRGGPMAVVTNMGVLKFAETTKEMYLAEYYPGLSIESILEKTGFPLETSSARESTPPSDEELRILREEVDPQKLIL
ncbi:MAG TPA: CoA-transferase, partial [Thermodesulfobacteriota bacterium]|nr:CoA-transferase [Thermodesulfobacteriota bacterium]